MHQKIFYALSSNVFFVNLEWGVKGTIFQKIISPKNYKIALKMFFMQLCQEKLKYYNGILVAQF